MRSKNKVLVSMPTDYMYEYPFIVSYAKAIQLHEDEGVYNCRYSAYKNIVGARNESAYDALQDRTITHVFFMDSDMKFEELTLSRLLAHNKDIVGGLYMRKGGEFYPNVFRIVDDGTEHGQMQTFFPKAKRGELVECAAIGTGCMLINVDVFRKIEPPWFLYEPYFEPDKRHKTQTEDIVFCRYAREAGYKIYVDPNIHAGHVGLFTVWPEDETRVRTEPL